MKVKGYCKYCGKEFTKAGIVKHLKSCKHREKRLEEAKKTVSYFQIGIGSKETPHWLIVHAHTKTSLCDLDQFLRDIWLECCGHLSCFTIGETRYSSNPDNDVYWGRREKSMSAKLRNVLEVGMKFEYEYDFGSTTTLQLVVYDLVEEDATSEVIEVVSRNHEIEWKCGQCKRKKAEWIHPFEYEQSPFWCENCLKKEGIISEDGGFLDPIMLPVCNSPRMGVCGYEGSPYYPDQFEPDVR